MNEAAELFKWVASQSDRVVFLAALSVGGWLFWRVLKRSENQTDTMLLELKETRQQHHERMEGMQAKVFENCKSVTAVVQNCTSVMERNIKLLERVEEKL